MVRASDHRQSALFAQFDTNGDQGEDNVVIAPRFLPELRKLPDDVLSFPKAVEKVSF